MTSRTQGGLWIYDYGTEPPAAGTGAPLVVLVHGSMDRGTSFARLRSCLRDLHVVAYDRRGYNRSGSSDQVAGAPFEQHVKDLFEVLDERSTVILGHSFGGDVALAAAAERPDLVRAVVAFEPPLLWSDWWPRPRVPASAVTPEDAAERFIRRMIGDARWERLPRRTRDDRRREGPALVAELGSVRDRADAGLPPPFEPGSLRIPVIIGRGSETVPHQMRGTSELASEIPGARLIEIAGAGHGAHLSHPSQLAAMVRTALSLAWSA